MSRLIEKMVCFGLVTAWRLATWPPSRSPSLVNATTEGVVRPPSALGMTTGSPPSMTATTEFVVPRSMPMTLSAIGSSGVFVERRARAEYTRRHVPDRRRQPDAPHAGDDLRAPRGHRGDVAPGAGGGARPDDA